MSDEDTHWLGFRDTVEFLQSPGGPATKMVSIYHTRETYIEAFFSGLILVPKRRLRPELAHPTFSFVPRNTKRRLLNYSKRHFLTKAVRKLTRITLANEIFYLDENKKLAAKQLKRISSYAQEVEITLRRDILDAYCQYYNLLPVWVVNSYRLSERSIHEIDLTPERIDVAGSTFCYFRLFREPPEHFRARMSSLSLICGKRLLFP